jgi:hypothetical protein
MTPSEAAQLKKIISIAQTLLAKGSGGRGGNGQKNGGEGQTRIRRAGKELVAFRKMLKAERKAGVPVADLARKHGVSASYIYQLG